MALPSKPTKESGMQYVGAISKMTDLGLFPSKSSNITIIQIYAPTINEGTEVEWVYEDLQDLLELIPRTGSFHHRELECKSRRSRDTVVTGNIGLGVQNEAKQRLTELVKRMCWS